MCVAEHLVGVQDHGDIRGHFYTIYGSAHFLYVRQPPNSPTPDMKVDYTTHCPSDGSLNLPSQNLPCGSVPHSDWIAGQLGPFYSGLRSRHRGGVNVLFADGSIHFIHNTIALNTWQSLGWIADGPLPGDY